MSLTQFFKNEISGRKKWEVLWLVAACAVITGLALFWHDSLMRIISATTGVACVVCTGKGKLSAYIFGLINVVLYTIISFRARYYGEVMLNALYSAPMQFYGFYVWSRHMDAQTHEVIKKKMDIRSRGLLTAAIAAGTFIYGVILEKIGGELPFVDSLSTVSSVAAMIVSVKIYMEQWVIWFLVDLVSVAMWMWVFIHGNESIATLLMWIVYLLNAVIMYYKWSREADARYTAE